MELLIWEARKRQGLTLVRLAEISGISKTTLNDIENGKVSPTMLQMEKIAAALHMRISNLYESEHK